MQLDKTYIAIRERDMLDIMDVSLHVVRAFFRPLLLATAAGVLPVALLHHWLVGGFDLLAMDEDALFYETGWRFEVAFQSIAFVVFFAPLAAGPITLFLGQALFTQRAQPGRILREWLRSMPQLLLFQVVLRGLLFLPVVTCFVPFAAWPYLNEIILLERNPLFGRRRGKMTTMRRSSALHGSNFGDLFARWMACASLGVILCGLLFLALWLTKAWITGNFDLSRLTYVVYLEISLWTTASFFAVVRFLSYLDLRIRREGWEVELQMRAEGARLAEQLS